jgi:hypothetical protein
MLDLCGGSASRRIDHLADVERPFLARSSHALPKSRFLMTDNSGERRKRSNRFALARLAPACNRNYQDNYPEQGL